MEVQRKLKVTETATTHFLCHVFLNFQDTMSTSKYPETKQSKNWKMDVTAIQVALFEKKNGNSLSQRKYCLFVLVMQYFTLHWLHGGFPRAWKRSIHQQLGVMIFLYCHCYLYTFHANAKLLQRARVYIILFEMISELHAKDHIIHMP